MYIVRLGLMDYGKALEIQEKLLEKRQQNLVGDVLLLVEHPPVLTVGRSGKYSNIITGMEELKSLGITVYDVNRGGDVTYHGPGQVVGYPVMGLDKYGRDVKEYVWRIEEVFIRLLKEEFNITAHREEKKYTGVWVDDEKITAIGIAVKRWVTMHGFAFNVNTNLEHFKWINPCGITDKGVTSLQKILRRPLDFNRLNDLVTRYFCDVFSVLPEKADMDELLNEE